VPWVYVMGKLALPHRGRAGILPPSELLESFIERTNNHWYWLGEFFDDGLDRSAEFRWAPPAEHSTNFMVPRLLWQYLHPEHTGKRLMLENACGLFTCINPGHWTERGVAQAIPTELRLLETSQAWPAQTAGIALVHIIRSDAESAVCGAGGARSRLHRVPLTEKVTCYACIAVWVAQKQPYEVVL